MAGSVYTVTQVNRYVKNMFQQDYLLGNIVVQGEVSNLKYHTSGHIYFSLKDSQAAISCVMFAGQRAGLGFRMKDGDQVLVRGSIDVFERDGRYQMYAKQITLDGIGALYERFQALKQELSEMGMFEDAYKKPIPRHVKRLGVVTAPTGAAVQDIRNVSLRRNPYVQIILYPALVQGEGAKESVARGIAALDALGVDCIIVGRGGGSLEDLWAFNERVVAQAIFACQTPVISAVGHETDFTIADFVADRRAPTPSAAAELAVEDLSATLQRLDHLQSRLTRGMEGQLREKNAYLGHLEERLRLLHPKQVLEDQRQRLSGFQGRLPKAMEGKLQVYRHSLSILEVRLSYLNPTKTAEQLRSQKERLEKSLQKAMEGKVGESRQRLALLASKLSGLSPLAKLGGGYAYVSREGVAVTSVSQVQPGDALRVVVTDGAFTVRVETREDENNG